MTDPQVALLMLAMLLFAILLGFPITFTLVAMGVGFRFYAYYNPAVSVIDNNVFNLLVNQTYSVMSNDVLVAVPLFLFMGYVVERSNIVDRLFFALNIAARHIRRRWPWRRWRHARCSPPPWASSAPSSP